MKTSSDKMARLQSLLLGAQLAAAAHVRKVVRGEHPDAHLPWKEVTGRTRAAIYLAQGSMAAERAQRMADTVHTFGIVLMQARIESDDEWEDMAARVRDGKAIEGAVLPALPAKDPDVAA